jgi:hypothetical protein
MAEPLTFEPETVGVMTPQQQREALRSSVNQYIKVRQDLSQAAGRFDIGRFRREILPKLLSAYNDLRKDNPALLPIGARQVETLGKFENFANNPRAFLAKHKSQIMPRFFPGDPAKAEKSYQELLKASAELPSIMAGPVSGGLGHELGHQTIYQMDPEVSVQGTRPEGSKKATVAKTLDEALASWRGYQMAWKAWGQYGLPHKAWSAWMGFPTYAVGLTDAELQQLLEQLKKFDNKYKGIYEQARTAMFQYNEYVAPTLYNMPGPDWTEDEKKALERFLRTRGAPYRQWLPESGKSRHMKRQPYVLAPATPPTATMASLKLPLSKRILPLSKREGAIG